MQATNGSDSRRPIVLAIGADPRTFQSYLSANNEALTALLGGIGIQRLEVRCDTLEPYLSPGTDKSTLAILREHGLRPDELSGKHDSWYDEQLVAKLKNRIVYGFNPGWHAYDGWEADVRVVLLDATAYGFDSHMYRIIASSWANPFPNATYLVRLETGYPRKIPMCEHCGRITKLKNTEFLCPWYCKPSTPSWDLPYDNVMS